MTSGLAACGRSHPPQIAATSAGPTTPIDAGGHLAGLAAAAQDQRFVAAYTYRVKGRADRTVVVSVANDSSWSVNIPGGALSGGADVSIVGMKAGVYQCVVGGSATTLAPVVVTSPTPAPPAPPSASGSLSPSMSPSPPPPPAFPAPACAKIATDAQHIPAAYDPVVEHVFTDWLTIFSSRNGPFSVFNAKPVAGASGSCFSVEPSAASLAPVVDAGIYCFRADGLITAVTLANASLTLTGSPAAGAPTNGLPGPITTASPAPLQTTSPQN